VQEEEEEEGRVLRRGLYHVELTLPVLTNVLIFYSNVDPRLLLGS
jgi:hypothetical protein